MQRFLLPAVVSRFAAARSFLARNGQQLTIGFFLSIFVVIAADGFQPAEGIADRLLAAGVIAVGLLFFVIGQWVAWGHRFFPRFRADPEEAILVGIALAVAALGLLGMLYSASADADDSAFPAGRVTALAATATIFVAGLWASWSLLFQRSWFGAQFLAALLLSLFALTLLLTALSPWPSPSSSLSPKVTAEALPSSGEYPSLSAVKPHSFDWVPLPGFIIVLALASALWISLLRRSSREEA
jgi:hypothetical protein